MPPGRDDDPSLRLGALHYDSQVCCSCCQIQSVLAECNHHKRSTENVTRIAFVVTISRLIGTKHFCIDLLTRDHRNDEFFFVVMHDSVISPKFTASLCGFLCRFLNFRRYPRRRPSRTFREFAGATNMTFRRSFLIILLLPGFISLVLSERHVSAGSDHICIVAGAIANNSIACFTTDAAAASGDLGSSDAKLSFRSGPFQAVSVGDAFTCGLYINGSARCWGSSLSASFGDGPFIDIAAGAAHACALRLDGSLLCLGDSTGSGGASAPPATLPPLKAFSCARRYCLAVSRSGALVGWGDATSPVLSGALPGGSCWVEVAAGERHAIAINCTGGALAWGDAAGAAGALAMPASTPAVYPSYEPDYYNSDPDALPPVEGSPPVWAWATAGADVSCGLIGESLAGPRLLMCWGADGSGAGGVDGAALAAGAPADPAGSTVWEVSCGRGLCAAIDGEGMLQAWTASSSTALLPSPGLAAALAAAGATAFPASACGWLPDSAAADDSLLVFRTLSAGRVIGDGNDPISSRADGECAWGHVEAPVRIRPLPPSDPRIVGGSGPLATVGGGALASAGPLTSAALLGLSPSIHRLSFDWAQLRAIAPGTFDVPGVRGLRELWLLRGTCGTGDSARTPQPVCGVRLAAGSFAALESVHSVNMDPANAGRAGAVFAGLGVHSGPAVGSLSLHAFAGLGGPRNVTAALEDVLAGRDTPNNNFDARITEVDVSRCNVSEFLPMPAVAAQALPHLEQISFASASRAVPNASFDRPPRPCPVTPAHFEGAQWDAEAAAAAAELDDGEWELRYDAVALQSGLRLRRGWLAGMPRLNGFGSASVNTLNFFDLCPYSDLPGEAVAELVNASTGETRTVVTQQRTLHLDSLAGLRLVNSFGYAIRYYLNIGVLQEGLRDVPHCVNTRFAASPGALLPPTTGGAVAAPGLPFAPRIFVYDLSGLNASAAAGGIAGIFARVPAHVRAPTKCVFLVNTPSLTTVTAADFAGCPALEGVFLSSAFAESHPAFASRLSRLDVTTFSRASHPALRFIDTRNTPLAASGCPAGYTNTQITLAALVIPPQYTAFVCDEIVPDAVRTGAVIPACAACPAGGWCELGYQIFCPAGTYSDRMAAEDASTCQPCAPGTTNVLTGQPRIGCVQCAPGFAGAAAGGAADPAACLSCSPGRYADAPGLVACRSCPKGTWARADAVAAAQSSVCQPCALGRWSSAEGSMGNSTGSTGSGSSNSGSEPCTACPAGLTTLARGATSVDSCITTPCLPGRGRVAAGGDTCSPCAAGYASAGGSGMSCEACPPGRWAAAEASTCTACEGHTARASTAGTAAASCVSCPAPHTRCTADRSSCMALCPAGMSLREDAAARASVAALLAQQPPVCGPLTADQVAAFCTPCSSAAGDGAAAVNANANASLCFAGRAQPLLSLAWAGDDATGTRGSNQPGVSSESAYTASAAGSLAAVLGLPVSSSATGSSSSSFSLSSLGLSGSTDSGGNTFAPDCAGYVRATLVERPAAAYSSARASLLVATVAIAIAVPLVLVAAKRAAERCGPRADTHSAAPAGTVASATSPSSKQLQLPSTQHQHHPHSRCASCGLCINRIAASVTRIDMFATQHVPGEDRILKERANFTGGLCALAFAAAAIGVSATVLMRLSIARYALSSNLVNLPPSPTGGAATAAIAAAQAAAPLLQASGLSALANSTAMGVDGTGATAATMAASSAAAAAAFSSSAAGLHYSWLAVDALLLGPPNISAAGGCPTPAPDAAAAAAGWSLKSSSVVSLADAALLSAFSLPPPSALPPQLAGAQACRLLLRCDACRVSAAAAAVSSSSSPSNGLSLSLSLPRVYQSIVLTLAAREAFPQCAPRARAAFIAAPPGDAPLTGASLDVRISPVAFAYTGTGAGTGTAAAPGEASSAGASGSAGGAAAALQSIAAAGGSSSGFDLSIMNARAITAASGGVASSGGSAAGSVTPPSLLLFPDADTLQLTLSFSPTGSASVLLASDAIDPLAVITTIVGFVSGLAGGFAVAMRLSERARGTLGQSALVQRCSRSRICAGCRRVPGAMPLSSHSARRGKAGWQQQAVAAGLRGRSGSVLAHDFSVEMTMTHAGAASPQASSPATVGAAGGTANATASFNGGGAAAGSRSSVQLVSGINLMAPSASIRRLAAAQAQAGAAAAAQAQSRQPAPSPVHAYVDDDDRGADAADAADADAGADTSSSGNHSPHARRPVDGAGAGAGAAVDRGPVDGAGAGAGTAVDSQWARRSRVSSAAGLSLAAATAGARVSFSAAAHGAEPIRHFPMQLQPTAVRNPLSTAM